MKEEAPNSSDQSSLFQALFNYSSEAILVVDKKGVIQLNNPKSEKLFGYQENELKGQEISVLIPEALHHSHAKHIANYNKQPSPRSMAAGMDLFAQKKDKSQFPVNISLSPTSLGEHSLIVCMVMDITEQEFIKSKLKKLNADLELKVKARTSELTDLVNKLEDKNKALQIAEDETKAALEKEKELNELKSRFVSTASHEFRTPLSAILSSCSLIERYNTPETSEKKAKHLARIKKSVRYLTNILNDFLSLDKIEEGSFNINFSDFDLKQLALDAIEDLSPSLKKGQEINFIYKGDVTINSDHNILKNTFNNLLSNAIKYSQEDKTITFTISNNDLLQIKVVDQGIGIPDEEKNHLFNRFFRAKNAFNIDGTGLGLHIVKKYIEKLNGTITFDSQYMKGTTFVIHIPNN